MSEKQLNQHKETLHSHTFLFFNVLHIEISIEEEESADQQIPQSPKQEQSMKHTQVVHFIKTRKD